MATHFTSLFVSQRLAKVLGEVIHFIGKTYCYIIAVFEVQWHERSKAGGSFNQGTQSAAVARTHHQVPLPMA